MPSTTRSAPSAAAGGLEAQRDEVGALFARWQAERDETAREALVERFMPLARSLAQRYRHSSEPFEDLLQVASLGLLNAIERFDPERGHAFQSFAVPTILGEMRRYFRDSAWSVHMPRGSQERALEVRDAHEQLSNERGRAPTITQLAEYLELGTESVIDALQALQAYDTVSLDAPLRGAEDDGTAVIDSVGNVDERYELIELDATIRSVLEQIPARERSILHLRFVEERTQTEIAERIGVSQMQVSRLLRRSLDQLRCLTRDSAGGL